MIMKKAPERVLFFVGIAPTIRLWKEKVMRDAEDVVPYGEKRE